jgi:hypothetical protein
MFFFDFAEMDISEFSNQLPLKDLFKMIENFLKTQIHSFDLIKFTIINQHLKQNFNFSNKHYQQVIDKKSNNYESLKYYLKKLDFESNKRDKFNNSIYKVYDWFKRNEELEDKDLFTSSDQISQAFKNARDSVLLIRKHSQKVKMKDISVYQRKINMIRRIRREFFGQSEI